MSETKEGGVPYTVVQLQEALEERQTPDRRETKGEELVGENTDRRKDDRRLAKS